MNGVRTLQLGTLRSYDGADNSLLQTDNAEGKLGLVLSGINLTLERRKKLAQHSYYQGMQSITFGNGTAVTIHPQGQMESSKESSNCFMFCCAVTEKSNLKEAKKINPDYNDSYPIHDTRKFANFIGCLILQQIQPNHLRNSPPNADNDKSDLSLIIKTKEVDYFDPPNKITNKNFDKTLENSKNYSLAFTKREKYKAIPEFRFIFTVETVSGKILPVSDGGILLKLPKDLPKF